MSSEAADVLRQMAAYCRESRGDTGPFRVVTSSTGPEGVPLDDAVRDLEAGRRPSESLFDACMRSLRERP